MKLCSIGVHKWSQWGEAIDGYARINQFRHCQDCHIITDRSVYFGQIPADKINKSEELAILPTNEEK